jgi:hypothetical protein
MKFERAPRDVATEVVGGYKAPEFETRALQHSNVKLTWDDDEPTRVKALRRKFDADQLNEMDFRFVLNIFWAQIYWHNQDGIDGG